MSGKKRTSYFFDHEVGGYYYGAGHPMKPQRIRAAHELIEAYDLYRHLDVVVPKKARYHQLSTFHSEDYVDFLKRATPDISENMALQMKRFNVGHDLDCPIYDGMYDHQRTCAGGSIEAAQRLNAGLADIAINWAGGLHHAKRAEASGFCYFNDIVLCILELLKVHQRVMYIDIDIHHGDGVEEAFLHTDRVLTLSLHKYGDYFPGTGALGDYGVGRGKAHVLNVPLEDGMDDRTYMDLFDQVVDRCIEKYRPGAIVLQCGADSLTGDRLGVWNLSLHGHAYCVEVCKRKNVPLVLLGGGGYTLRNVARCWAYETATALGLEKDMAEDIPSVECSNLFGDSPQLHLKPDVTMANKNTKEKMDKLKVELFKRIDAMEAAPTVQLNADVPPAFFGEDIDGVDLEEEDAIMDDEMRSAGRAGRVMRNGLLSAADNEESGAAIGRGGA